MRTKKLKKKFVFTYSYVRHMYRECFMPNVRVNEYNMPNVRVVEYSKIYKTLTFDISILYAYA